MTHLGSQQVAIFMLCYSDFVWRKIEREKSYILNAQGCVMDNGRDGVGLTFIWTRSYRRGRSVFTIYVRTYMNVYCICIYSCGGKLSDETVRERGARRGGSVDVASVSDCCGNAFH